MAWFLLLISGLLETVWASALGESRGFSRPVPTTIFAVAVVLSMGALAYSLTRIPVGTGYAVFVGIGAVGTAAYGIAFLGEPATRCGWPVCCSSSPAWSASSSRTRECA